MPDITVKQVGMQPMESTSARQPSILDAYKPGVKFTPSYLVILEEGKKTVFFIAVNFVETANTAKCTGFFSSEAKEKIIASYDEIIRSTELTNFVEILFPWLKIQSVRSLVYKHKATK